MSRITKTRKEWIVQGNYGRKWDDENTESTQADGKRSLREYQENGPGAYRLITRRVPISPIGTVGQPSTHTPKGTHTMSTIDTILFNSFFDRDEADALIYELINIDQPGACAIREPDGRLMVWASAGEDASRYHSSEPISDAAWRRVRSLAWIESI